MFKIFALLLIGFSGAYDIEKIGIELIPLFEEESQQGAPNLTASELEVLQNVYADLKTLEECSEFEEVSELSEELLRFRQTLNRHDDDYEKAVTSSTPFVVFSPAFIEISTLSSIPKLGNFYLQIYYDTQLAKLFNRLDNGRSTYNKVMATNEYRISRTQEAINSLNVYAALMGLNTHSNSGYLGKIMQFFSQRKAADIYFRQLFLNVPNEYDRQNLLDIGLSYLVQRYKQDRSWLNKWLTYFGWKCSYTQEAITTLQTISREMKITVREDYKALIDAADQKMLEEAIDYFI